MMKRMYKEKDDEEEALMIQEFLYPQYHGSAADRQPNRVELNRIFHLAMHRIGSNSPDQSEGIEILQKAALEYQHAESILQLAQLYYSGECVKQDHAKAIQLLQDLVKWSPSRKSLNLLASWMDESSENKAASSIDSKSVTSEYEESEDESFHPSLALWKRASDEFDSISAMHKVAQIYESLGETERALTYWKKAADRGDIHALRLLVKHEMISNEQPTSNQGSSLLHHLEHLSSLNDGEALYYLGQCYSQGLHGVPANAILALDYYRRALEQGTPAAASSITHLLMQGAPGILVDESLGLEFGKKCAKLGLMPSHKHLGDFCADKGLFDQAALHYQEAVTNDQDADAYLPLANLFMNGTGVAKDPVMAFEFYSLAWDKTRNMAALPHIIFMLDNGIGASKDTVQSARFNRIWTEMNGSD